MSVIPDSSTGPPHRSACAATREGSRRIAFRSLSLNDYARLDLRLTDDDEVWVMEVNANPFISYGHDMANAAEKAGAPDDYVTELRARPTGTASA